MTEIESQTEFERQYRLKYAELYADQIFADEFGQNMDESIMDDADLMGMSEEEIDKQCSDIFGEAPPIQFKARSGE